MKTIHKSFPELKARQRLLNLPVFLCLAPIYSMWLFLNIILTPVMYLIVDMTLSSIFIQFFSGAHDRDHLFILFLFF